MFEVDGRKVGSFERSYYQTREYRIGLHENLRIYDLGMILKTF